MPRLPFEKVSLLLPTMQGSRALLMTRRHDQCGRGCQCYSGWHPRTHSL